MPITILKNSSTKFSLPLIDNEGNSYTVKQGTMLVVNDTPALGSVAFDEATLTGTITSLGVNGQLKYYYECLTLQGKAITGSDTVTIADTVPAADANQVIPLYTV